MPHSARFLKYSVVTILLCAVVLLPVLAEAARKSAHKGFVSVKQRHWDESHVRKVLQAFAYGGHTSDAQIASWARMKPASAIKQMLTFDYVNTLLSPTQDASAEHAESLEALQAFWSGDDTRNPQRWDKRRHFPALSTDANGVTSSLSSSNLQRTWAQALNTRGINPFLHKTALYLSNYQLAISVHKTRPSLIRAYYDAILSDLASGESFTTLVSNASRAAAVARAYGHQYNTFNNEKLSFSGNDDFAREYFQLFFRIQGETEDPLYHESVTIENNAKLLTGMNLDRVTNAFGSTSESDWYIAPIDFSDHTDETGRVLYNFSKHHADCLEILHTQICGSTASEKLKTLALVASNHPEAKANLPVHIINFFADDQLNEEKTAAVQAGWIAAQDDLLAFLQAYAISVTFHRSDTVKFRSAFDRNLALQNAVVLDNNESFNGRQHWETARRRMNPQGAEVFVPAHDVFGGQIGLQAANNPYIFRAAYRSNVNEPDFLGRSSRSYYTDRTETEAAVWEKDWASRIPENDSGKYIVSEVADWLWQHIVGDNGNNFDVIARSQVYSLIAYGADFGYVVSVYDPAVSADPERMYGSEELTNDPALQALIDTIANETLPLNDTEPDARLSANEHIGLAVNFISMMPYTFALEAADSSADGPTGNIKDKPARKPRERGQGRDTTRDRSSR